MPENRDGSSRHFWELSPFLAIVAAICGLAWLESELAAPSLAAGETDVAGHPRTAVAVPAKPMSAEDDTRSGPTADMTVPVPRPRPATAGSSPG